MTTYASDTFTRTNSSSAMGNSEGPGTPAWTSHVNVYGIISNLAYRASGTTALLGAASLPIAVNDVTVQCTVLTSATNNRAHAGLCLRYADNDNNLFAVLSKSPEFANHLLIQQRVAGVPTTLASVASAGLINNGAYVVKSVINGTNISLVIDDVERIPPTAFDASLTTQRYGIHSIRGSGASYDDGNSFWNDFLVDDSLNTPPFYGYTRPQQAVYRM